MPELLNFARGVALDAGKLIARMRADAELQQKYKDGTELVTDADLAADKLIVAAIKQRFPDHGILSEESSPEMATSSTFDEPIWIVDPIDGTVNFAHGHNQSAVSIAFAEKGRVTTGVVYNPFTDEMFSASLGGGATLNNSPITVSSQPELRRAIVATGFPYTKNSVAELLKYLDAVLHQCADIRRLGSAALDICWVAAGRIDAYYETVSIWDFAAAQLIAREAGATFGHFGPVPTGKIPEFHPDKVLITNPHLFGPLQALLQQAV